MVQFILARNTGEPIGELTEITDRAMSFELNGIHTASCAVRFTDPLAPYLTPHHQMRLKIYLDGQLRFYGPLPEEGIYEDYGAGVVRCVFQDPRVYLTRQYLFGNEVLGSTDGEIAWSIASTIDEVIAQGQITGTSVRSREYNERSGRWEAIQALTTLAGGPDIDVLPYDGWLSGTGEMGTFNVYSTQGQERPNAPLVFSEDTENAANITRTWRSPLTRVEVTYLNSDGIGTVQSTVVATEETTSPYGLRQLIVADGELDSEAAAREIAYGRLERYRNPVPVIEVSDVIYIRQPGTGPESLLGAPRPFRDFYLGDSLPVVAQRGTFSLNGLLRVHGFGLSWDQAGTMRMNLTMADDRLQEEDPNG